ncbi:hypothetical protein ACJW31_11G190100 [Castanea mollissima]
MSTQFGTYTKSVETIYTPNSSLYSYLLQSSQQNPRCIAKRSGIHGFPAGLCPSVGVGGYISSGGFGTLLRKYGLAADNVLDAYLIDANGKIMDKKQWERICFGLLEGRIKLVRVPPTVTTFNIKKTLEQGATKLVSKWQNNSDKLHEDLFIRVIIQNVGNGTQRQLMPLMNESFPELGLQAENCTEMNQIQSILFLNGFQTSDPLEVLLDRKTSEPISDIGLEGIWKRFLKEERISESDIPFPQRKGNLYNIQYLVWWEVNGIKASKKHFHWIRMLYTYMRPYVSRFPRAAYLNYRDLDLGTNKESNVSYLEARVWGLKYFKGNFKRLAQVKSKVDPKNFFRNEQSIPLLLESGAD